MNPVSFPQQNVVIALSQPPYLPLPSYRDADDGGRNISCWHMSFLERVKVLFTGKVWLYTLTFGKPFQPQKLMVDSPFKVK